MGRNSLHLRLADDTHRDRAERLIAQVLGTTPRRTPEAAVITAPVADPGAVADLMIRLRAEGVGIDEIGVQRPSLDEVFLTLTGHAADDDTTDRSAA